MKWILVWDGDRISHNFRNGPNYASTILYYLFMQNRIFDIGDKIKISFLKMLKVSSIFKYWILSQDSLLYVKANKHIYLTIM